MKRRTRFRLGITLMLAAAFASAAMAQAAFAQTTGATGSTNDDQKVVFTWAGTAEPDSVKELDRQLTLNESILRTKVIRPDNK